MKARPKKEGRQETAAFSSILSIRSWLRLICDAPNADFIPSHDARVDACEFRSERRKICRRGNTLTGCDGNSVDSKTRDVVVQIHCDLEGLSNVSHPRTDNRSVVSELITPGHSSVSQSSECIP